MTEITMETQIQLRKGILARFEHNFNDGTMVLIDTDNDKLWFGNSGSELLIKKLRRSKSPLSVQEIYASVLALYEEDEQEQVFEGLNKIIEELSLEGFLEFL